MRNGALLLREITDRGIDFSRPGKPTNNCHVESFDRSFGYECLNLHWFETLEEAQAIIET